MNFADLKNDFVFRRIFATRPDILRGLLNDLLDRRGEQTIEGIEYLPSEQLPLVAGAKLSILDVRCKDRAGVTFIVEMQLLHMAGFENRVVYNACKAYAGQLQTGESYAKMADVVAISVCDFELWPDAKQDLAALPRVPMLSRWNMTERASGSPGLLQVQYAFVELPKLRGRKPETGAELWAWLFVHARELHEIPPDLPAGPHRQAVELANEATFSQGELDAYRKVADEIQQARDYGEEQRVKGRAEGEVKGRAEGEAKGRAQGRAQGEAQGRIAALLGILAARGLPVSDEVRAVVTACTDVAQLDRWLARALDARSAEDAVR